MADEILGIDVGGTGIKGAPVNVKTGKMIGERHRIKTPQPATPKAVAGTVREIVQHHQWQGPIGIGFPSVVKQGRIFTAANIDASWIGQNADKLFETRLKTKVTVINDADAAGLAEMKFGAGMRQDGIVIMITLGTGIGTAIFMNGVLFPNAELGHMIIRGKEAEHRAADSVRQKKEWSFKKWARNVSEYLNELDRLLWPDLFILGGGAVKEWDKFGKRLKVRARVVPAKLGNEAGIIGAALGANGKD